MPRIRKKKAIFKISSNLRRYLNKHNREIAIPINYEDLLRFTNKITLFDSEGNDTLWNTVIYSQSDMDDIHHRLKTIYSILKAGGDTDVVKHLDIDRVDLCSYGNTKPFRVRIVNSINDNFDYFYIKNADASRIYGLELEHILSPNRINYLVYENTILEEHIVGLPGDQFIKYHLDSPELNKIRLAKEFVKFNQRCFVRLLGDMHSSNFVVDITPDFDEVHYRIRAIDFDQQSFEGEASIYMPKYYKQNNPLILIGMEMMTPESMNQYQQEENSLIKRRMLTSKTQLMDLLQNMKKDPLSGRANIRLLREQLEDHYQASSFKKCQSMGAIVENSLLQVI